MSAAKIAAAHFGVIFDGQSLNGIPISPGSVNAYPPKMMSTRPNGVFVQPWLGGHAWAQLDDSFAERCAAYCRMSPITFYIMVGGTTDYGVGAAGATVYANEGIMANLAKASNPNIIVINTTTTPSVAISGTNETNRVAGNALTLADASNYFNAVVDLATKPELDDPNDTTYYSDGTHWKIAGCTAAAGYIGAVLDTYL